MMPIGIVSRSTGAHPAWCESRSFSAPRSGHIRNRRARRECEHAAFRQDPSRQPSAPGRHRHCAHQFDDASRIMELGGEVKVRAPSAAGRQPSPPRTAEPRIRPAYRARFVDRRADRLITLSTSAAAVCCCNNSRSSFSSRVFSMAMTACAAKLCSSSTCLSVKGSPPGDRWIWHRPAHHP